MPFNLHDELAKLEESCRRLVRICRIVGRHWRLFVPLALVLAVYFAARFRAYAGPQEFLEGYFSDVTTRDPALREAALDRAWKRLDPGLRHAISDDDERAFEEGYRNTDTAVPESIEPVDGRSWNPFSVIRAIFARDIGYETVNSVTDSFDPATCKSAEVHQQLVCHAARIADYASFDGLEGKEGNRIRVTRELKKRYLLRRGSLRDDWRIVTIDLLETRIRPQDIRH